MTQLIPRRVRALPLALMILVAGCGSSPETRIYVLGDPPAPAANASTLSGRPVIRLLPVSVPDYVDTQDILFRGGQNEVTASQTGRWAERLSVGMTHALFAALGTRLPAANIVAADRPIIPPVQQIQVDVESLEIRPDGRCLVIARWAVSSGDGLRVLRSERDTLIEQAVDKGDASIASAITRIIDRLADRIASGADTLR